MQEVVVVLRGGLGNQLFQLAFGLWLTGGDGRRLELNLASYARASPHGGYALRTLFGGAPFAAAETTDFRSLGGRRVTILDLKKAPDAHYEKLATLDGSTVVVADGWFQNYAYVSPVIEQLRRHYEGGWCSPGTEDEAFFAANTVIGVHYRRNDYLRPDVRELFGIVDPQAMGREVGDLRARIRSGKPVRVVAFSDGPVQGDFDRIYQREASPSLAGDIGALRLMSLCDHLVCSNSTFGLWAGYLGQRLKTVSLPSQWTRSGKISARLLLPPNGRLYPADLT